MTGYSLTSRIRSGGTDSLAIHCGDFRFQAAFHEFLNQSLNLNGNYDLMVIPGGPLSLTLFDYLPEYQQAASKWFRFFAEMHKISRLILIQHQDCAFYRSMPFELHSQAELRERQEQDLRRIKELARKEFAHLSVELYYASWNATERVTIETIST